MTQKRVWLFREGNADMRNLLGGKGANLAEMTNLGLPVPPGLTITTETCMDYINNGNKMPEGLMDEVKKGELDHVTIKNDVLRKYFPKSYTPKQMENTIIRLLEQWQRKKQRDQML